MVFAGFSDVLPIARGMDITLVQHVVKTANLDAGGNVLLADEAWEG